jgi:hypothetical protein
MKNSRRLNSNPGDYYTNTFCCTSTFSTYPDYLPVYYLGYTPLYFTNESDTPESNLLLLNSGADVMARTIVYHTPLHHAAFAETAEGIKFLLEAWRDMMSRDRNEWPPLHLAASVKVLFKTCADPQV